MPDHARIDDLDALLDIGQEEWQAGRVDRAIPAWHRYDELAAGASPTALQTARRVDGRGVERFAENDFDAAMAEWERAAGLYAEAGDLVSRHAALGRVGAIRCGQGREDEGLELLHASVAHLDEHAAGTRRAFAARMRLAGALLNTGRGQEALAALEPLVPPTTGDSGDLELMRARAVVRAGAAEDAVPLLNTARTALRESGEMGPLADASLLLGRILAHKGHQAPEGRDQDEVLDGALAVLDEAVSCARAADPWMTAVAHAERGTFLLSVQRPADAAPDCVEAVAGFTAAGATAQAAYARLDLANAYYSTGRHLEAAETAEEAVPYLAETDDPDGHRRARLLLAHAQAELGEEQAAGLFTELAEEDDDPAFAARLLELAAEVLTRLDKDALAAERFLTAAEAFAAAGDPYGVVRARRQAALCRLWTRRPEEGLAEMERARSALDDLPSGNPAALTWEAARVSYDQSRLLAEVGRLDDALAKVSEAIGGFEELEEKDAAEAAGRLRSDVEAALAQAEAESEP